MVYNEDTGPGLSEPGFVNNVEEGHCNVNIFYYDVRVQGLHLILRAVQSRTPNNHRESMTSKYCSFGMICVGLCTGITV